MAHCDGILFSNPDLSKNLPKTVLYISDKSVCVMISDFSHCL